MAKLILKEKNNNDTRKNVYNSFLLASLFYDKKTKANEIKELVENGTLNLNSKFFEHLLRPEILEVLKKIPS